MRLFDLRNYSLETQKKIVVIGVILTIAVIAGLFAKFATKDNPPVLKPVTLEYWGNNEAETAMKVLIDEYVSLHPNVTINYSNRQFDNDLVRYRKTLISRLKENTGPAMFRLHSTWVPEYLAELSTARGELSDYSSYKNRFYNIALDQCSTNIGDIYCVPIQYDGLSLLYNIDMFDQAGLQKPVTWEDVRATALKLTIRNGDAITRSGIALGTALNVSNSTDILGLMFAQSGVSVPIGLDTEAATAALTFYRNFAVKDKVWNSSMQNSILAFATEKVAMVFVKKDDIEKILGINPTLKFGSTGVPQLPNIQGTIKQQAWASLWVEAVNADLSDDEKNVAWDFLNWLSKPDQQKKLFAESLKFKKVGFVYSDRSLREELKNDVYLQATLESAPYSSTSFITDNTGNDAKVQALKATIESKGDASTDLKVVKAVLSK